MSTAPRWLTTDSPEVARAEFAAAVFGLDPERTTFHHDASAYAERWGDRELAAALRAAHQQAPLPEPAAALLRDLLNAGVG